MSCVGLRLYFSDSRIKSILERRLGEMTGGSATIAYFDIYGWLKLRIEKLALSSDAGDSTWFEIGEANVDLDPRSILSGKLHVRRAEISEGIFDFSGMPSLKAATPGAEATDGEFSLPLRVIIDTCKVTDFRVSDPRADFTLGINLENIDIKDLRNMAFEFAIRGESGGIHFAKDSIGVDGKFEFVFDGSYLKDRSARQRFRLNINGLSVAVPQEYDVGNIDVTALMQSAPGSDAISIDSMGLSLNSRTLIDCGGSIEFKPRFRLEIDATGREWGIASIADMADRLGIPLRPRGRAALSEARFTVMSSGIMYDFTLDITDLGLEFGDNFRIMGINGQIYSDGDMEQIIFGSSLMIDSALAIAPDGSTARLKGLSTAVEAELSKDEYSVNITSGITDFLGGNLDLSAFSDNSKITGSLKISDLNLSQVTMKSTGPRETAVFGLLDLKIDLGGILDSISADLQAIARDVTIYAQKDTLILGDQNLKIRSTTRPGKEKLETSLDYSIGTILSGSGSISYPLKAIPGDSLAVTFDMNIDNSLIPGYFPSSLAGSLGPVDISGLSELKGRLTSPPDSIALHGRSELLVKSTDLLMEDFQSLLSSLASSSRVEIDGDSIRVAFAGDIGEVFAEEYSDLSFPNINFVGKIVSTSDTTWELSDCQAEIPSLKSTVNIGGAFGTTKGGPFSDFRIDFDFNSTDKVELTSSLSVGGEFGVRATVSQRGDVLAFSGESQLRNLILEGSGGMYCEGIDGILPFSGKIDLSDSLFIKSERETMPNRSTYRRNRTPGRAQTGFGTITAAFVSIRDIAASDIVFDAAFRDGILEIPYYTGKILGGSFIGDLSCDLTEVNLMREYPNYRRLIYNISLETPDLDFNQLTPGLGPYKSKAGFTSTAHFRGSGIIASGEDYSIEGVFHIWNMGPKVVDRILDYMDPQNQNPGVVQTKDLLNKKILGFIDISYKPKEFIVEIKHGALYPALYMSQPSIIRVIPVVKVPMPIRYGRIPLNTILSAMEEVR